LYKWRIPLDTLEDALNDLGGFPFKSAHHTFKKRALFIAGTKSNYVPSKVMGGKRRERFPSLETFTWMIYYNRCTQRSGRFSRMLCLQSWMRGIGVSLHLWYSYSLLLSFLLLSCFCSTFSYSTRRKATWIHRDCIRLYKKQHCFLRF